MAARQRARRIRLVARQTLREATRLRLLTIVGAASGLFVIGVRALTAFNFGSSEVKFIADLGTGLIVLLGAGFTVTATVGLVLAEIEQGIAASLFATPLTRAEWVLGKFLGVLAVVTAYCVAMNLLLTWIIWQRETALFPGISIVNYRWIVTSGFLVGLKLSVLAACSVVVTGIAKTQAFAFAVCGAGFLIGHAHAFLRQAAESSTGSWLRATSRIFDVVAPDYLILTTEFSTPCTAMDLAWQTAYAILFVSAAVLLAIVVYQEREF